MSMRSVWKGHIQFSLVTIPVKVYNALEKGDSVKFNQLHKGCTSGQSNIGLSKFCKVCNASDLKTDDIEKGFEFEPGKFVLIGDEDLKKIKLVTNKAVEIIGFADPAEIPSSFLDESYFIAPDGPVGTKPFALLRDVMKDTGKVALGKVVLREREELVAISPYENGLLLQKLHHQHEVRSISAVPEMVNANATLAANEMKLAHTLVDSMLTTFAELDQVDHYHVSLKALIEAKKTGQVFTSAEEVVPAPALDIMAALQASLDASTRKPMAKAKTPAAAAATSLKLVGEKKKKVKVAA